MIYQPNLAFHSVELRNAHRVHIADWFEKETKGVRFACVCGAEWTMSGHMELRGMRIAMAKHLDEQRAQHDTTQPGELAMLKKGSSKQVVSENIKEMKEAGYPQKQAVAAALHTAHPKGGKAPAAKPTKGKKET